MVSTQVLISVVAGIILLIITAINIEPIMRNFGYQKFSSFNVANAWVENRTINFSSCQKEVFKMVGKQGYQPEITSKGRVSYEQHDRNGLIAKGIISCAENNLSEYPLHNIQLSIATRDKSAVARISVFYDAFHANIPGLEEQ